MFEEDKLMEVWRAHYDKISNEEFAWDRNSLTNVSVSPVCMGLAKGSQHWMWQLER